MNIETNPVIKMYELEYDIITSFSDALDEFCNKHNGCDDCNLCKIIQTCQEPTTIIKRILTWLNNTRAIKLQKDIELKFADIKQTETEQWKAIDGNNGRVDYICPRCGQRNHYQSNYCPECGLKLGVCNLDA